MPSETITKEMMRQGLQLGLELNVHWDDGFEVTGTDEGSREYLWINDSWAQRYMLPQSLGLRTPIINGVALATQACYISHPWQARDLCAKVSDSRATCLEGEHQALVIESRMMPQVVMLTKGVAVADVLARLNPHGLYCTDNDAVAVGNGQALPDGHDPKVIKGALLELMREHFPGATYEVEVCHSASIRLCTRLSTTGGPCSVCPFLRKSPTRGIPEDVARPHCAAVAGGGDAYCHTRATTCFGAARFHDNVAKPGTFPEVFDTVDSAVAGMTAKK